MVYVKLGRGDFRFARNLRCTENGCARARRVPIIFKSSCTYHVAWPCPLVVTPLSNDGNGVIDTSVLESCKPLAFVSWLQSLQMIRHSNTIVARTDDPLRLNLLRLDPLTLSNLENLMSQAFHGQCIDRFCSL